MLYFGLKVHDYRPCVLRNITTVSCFCLNLQQNSQDILLCFSSSHRQNKFLSLSEYQHHMNKIYISTK